ncbi:MAG: hypothetical protein KDD38_06625, partial [Bdellovibrionales bacterium]|nr:hypothetical protein [Bdellovibrionales bacterium]
MNLQFFKKIFKIRLIHSTLLVGAILTLGACSNPMEPIDGVANLESNSEEKVVIMVPYATAGGFEPGTNLILMAAIRDASSVVDYNWQKLDTATNIWVDLAQYNETLTIVNLDKADEGYYRLELITYGR